MHDAHRQLFDLTGALRAAAAAGDEQEVARLAVVTLTELAIHLDDERLMGIELDAVDPDLAARLHRGQRRVVERLLDLADETATVDGPCRCRALADDVVALLDDEVAAEEVALSTHDVHATSGRGVGSVRGVQPPQGGSVGGDGASAGTAGDHTG